MAEKSPKRRRKRSNRYRATPGTLPGTLLAQPDSQQPVIQLIAYGPNELVDKVVENPADLKQYLGGKNVVWVNVEGLGNVETIEKIGEIFHIHKLVLEDVMNIHQRSKLEQYGERHYLILQMVEMKPDLQIEQLSIFFASNYVVTFQHGPVDSLQCVRERLHKNLGKLRSSGSDYLLYALVDSVIDSFFPTLEFYGERLETLEDQIIEQPSREAIGAIHSIKRDLLTLRRAMWPMRDSINVLLRDTPSMVSEDTQVHLRDCYDHAVQIIDFIETYRELGADLMDVYLSSISNRMNEVMKVLAVFTTVFVPPTLIAGIYGMNFDPASSPYNMPELKWYFGYPFALLLMVSVSLSILAFLTYKGWLTVLSTKDGTK